MNRLWLYLGLFAMLLPSLGWAQAFSQCENDFVAGLAHTVSETDQATRTVSCFSSHGTVIVRLHGRVAVDPVSNFRTFESISSARFKTCRTFVLHDNAAHTDTETALTGPLAATWRRYLKGTGCQAAMNAL